MFDPTQYSPDALIVICLIIGTAFGALVVWMLMQGNSEKLAQQKNTVRGLESRITERDKQISQKVFQNETLAKNITAQEAAASELTKKLAKSQNAEVNLKKTVDELQSKLSDMGNDSVKLEKLKRMSVDARLQNLKGVGDSVAAKLEEYGVKSIFDVAEMEQGQLDAVMTDAKVPGKLRKYDILEQAKERVKQLETHLETA